MTSSGPDVVSLCCCVTCATFSVELAASSSFMLVVSDENVDGRSVKGFVTVENVVVVVAAVGGAV